MAKLWTPTFVAPAQYHVKASVWNPLVGGNLSLLHQAFGFRLHLDYTTTLAPGNELQEVIAHNGTVSGGTFKVGYTLNTYDKTTGALLSSVTTYTDPMLWNIGVQEFWSTVGLLPGLGVRRYNPHLGIWQTTIFIDVNGWPASGGRDAPTGDINSGFEVSFDGPGLAGTDVASLLVDYSGLIGDTIDVNTLVSGDPFSYIYVSGYSGPYIAIATPGDATLQGLWWFHGHIAFSSSFGANNIEIRKKTPNMDGSVTITILAHASHQGLFAETECYVDIVAGESVGLYTDGSGLVIGDANTYLEGWFEGSTS